MMDFRSDGTDENRVFMRAVLGRCPGCQADLAAQYGPEELREMRATQEALDASELGKSFRGFVTHCDRCCHHERRKKWGKG